MSQQLSIGTRRKLSQMQSIGEDFFIHDGIAYVGTAEQTRIEYGKYLVGENLCADDFTFADYLESTCEMVGEIGEDEIATPHQYPHTTILRVDTIKWVDIDKQSVDPAVVELIETAAMPAYKDTLSLCEHLYCVEQLNGYFEDNSEGEEMRLWGMFRDAIEPIMESEDAAYFRFI